MSKIPTGKVAGLAVLFDRLAGILLTAIAFTLLASGVTRLITDVLQNPKGP